MKKTAIDISLILAAGSALAHSGGTDSCGGHNDRKHGGYYVHNQAKYCACHPEKCRPQVQGGKLPAESAKDQSGDGKE
jgi:hypothetical protein